MLRSLLAASVMVTIMQGVSAENLDVAGLTVGVDISTARDQVQKVNPDYEIKELRFADGTIAGLRAISPKDVDGRHSDQMVLLANSGGVVWSIGREQNYAKEDRLLLNSLDQSLIEKYGQPTSEPLPAVMKPFAMDVKIKRWEIDRAGKRSQGGSDSPCRTGFNQYDWSAMPETDIKVLKKFSPDCGILATSYASTDSDRLVDQLVVQIVDSKLMFDELSQKAAVLEQERQQQEKLRLESAANNKPKL